MAGIGHLIATLGKNLLFFLLCVVVFLVSLNVGRAIGVWKITDEKLGDLKVKWNNGTGIKISDVSYGGKPENKYDLYLPSSASKNQYALIFHIHGGGFNSGDKSEGEILCKYFVSKGFVAATTNYSLMDDTHSANVNTMYGETVAALTNVLDNCKNRGYPVSEMAVTGESAGGCLAMLLAFRYADECPVPIRFIIQESGPVSFEPSLWASTTKEGEIGFINSMAGGNFTLEDYNTPNYLDAINEISPISYVNENTIPILMAYGANDKIVPPQIKLPFIEKLDGYRTDYQYIEFPNSGHGLLGDSEKSKEYHAAMMEFAEKYFTH